MRPGTWNHNRHYARRILAAIPPGAQTALDIGCGEGWLAAQLAARIPAVTGIEPDTAALARARAHSRQVRWIQTGLLEWQTDERFDLITAVASLHHIPAQRAAFARLRELLAPGGTLIVIGAARPSRLSDRLPQLLGVLQHRWYFTRRGWYADSAPVLMPFPQSMSDIRGLADHTLPGAQVSVLPLWRCAVRWQAPQMTAR